MEVAVNSESERSTGVILIERIGKPHPEGPIGHLCQTAAIMVLAIALTTYIVQNFLLNMCTLNHFF